MRKPIQIALASLLIALAASTAHAQSGWGIGVVEGEIYFSDLARGRVVKLERDGRLRVLLEDVHCHNLAPGYDGYVYGEAVGTDRGGMGDVMAIWRVGPNGELGNLVGQTFVSARGAQARMPAPLAPGAWIARDAAGNSYAWSAELQQRSQIVKRTPAGEVSVLAGDAWGHADGIGAAAQFAEVGGLAVTRDGTAYVADGGHLRRVEPDGAVTTLARDIVSSRTGGIPGRGDLFNHSMGVAVANLKLVGAGRALPGSKGEASLAPTTEETVLIVDHYNQRVVAWSAARGARVLHRSANWLSRMTGDDGLGWYIRGVAASGDDIYVLEDFTSPPYVNDLVGTPRIRHIAPDGLSQIIATIASWPLRTVLLGVLAGLVYGMWRWRKARVTKIKSAWA